MKNDRLHIRVSKLFKQEIEFVLPFDIDISTFCRIAIMKEIKRIKNKLKKEGA
jgi:hypothetical protein